MLEKASSHPLTLDDADLFITEDILRQVYERPDAGLIHFMRHILGEAHLESREEVIRDAVDAYMAEHPEFSATQLNFLRTIRATIIQGMQVSPEDLEALPFARVGNVHRLFSAAQIEEIIDLSERLAG